MANIDTDFAAYLSFLAMLPVQQNTISEDKRQPYIWFQRQSDDADTFLDGTPALAETHYVVEVSGWSVDDVEATADMIKSSLNGYRGVLNFAFAHGCFVEQCSDDYIFRNEDEDLGNHVCAFTVRVIH